MSDFCEYEWATATRGGNAAARSLHHHQQHYDSTRYRTDSPNSSPIRKYDVNEPAERARALTVLRDLIGASVDFALKDKSCCHDEEFLYRFLFAKKFDVDAAFKLIIAYHEYKQRNVEMLQKMSALDEQIQMALRDGFPGVVQQRDRRGRKVIVFFTANWNPAAYSLVTVYRAMLLSLEKLLEDKQNQANGFVAVVDWTNFTMRQSTHLNPKVLKLMIEGLQVSAIAFRAEQTTRTLLTHISYAFQDCFPIRFKAVHFVGQPWYVEAALAVIRPFLKEKTRERIHLHGSNLSTLHESITKDILPTELGGEAAAINPLDWVHTLLECSQMTDGPANATDAPNQQPQQPQRYRLTQATVYSKPPVDYIRNTTCLLQQDELHT